MSQRGISYVFSQVFGLVFVLLSCSIQAYAQTTTSIQLLTLQEQQYLNTAKSVHKEYQKLHKHYLKDSTRLSKKVIKKAQSKAGNPKEQVESEVNQQIKSLSDSLYTHYGLDNYEQTASQYKDEDGKIDWTTISKDQLSQNQSKLSQFEEYDQLQSLKSEAGQYTDELDQTKSYLDNPDSLFSSNAIDKAAESQIMKLDEMQELQTRSSELEVIKELPAQYKKIMEQYQNRISDAANKEALQHEAKRYAQSLSKNVIKKHGDKIESAQSQLEVLKKKYATVPSSNDLSTATKASSLKDEPFKNRLVIGGNFQLSRSTETTNLDLAPILGYKFNRKWSMGLSGVYRSTFGQQEEFFDYIMQDQVYGGRMYTEFIFWKGFFGHGEYERMNNQVENSVTGDKYRLWSDGILLGLGKGYTIKQKLKGNIMLLYNVIHDEEASPYKSPWQVRFGVGRL